MPTEAEDRNETELQDGNAVAVEIELELAPVVDAVVGEAGERRGRHSAGSGALTLTLLLWRSLHLKEGDVACLDVQHPLWVSWVSRVLQQQQQQRPERQLRPKQRRAQRKNASQQDCPSTISARRREKDWQWYLMIADGHGTQ